MIDDTLRLTIDKIFDTKYDFHKKGKSQDKEKYISPYPVPGFSLDENMW